MTRPRVIRNGLVAGGLASLGLLGLWACEDDPYHPPQFQLDLCSADSDCDGGVCLAQRCVARPDDAGPDAPSPSDAGCDADLEYDSLNCGQCNVVCAAPSVCSKAVCREPAFPSDGGLGPSEPAPDAGTITIPPGVHNYTTIHIPEGVTVRVSGSGVLDLRAQGDVLIEGTMISPAEPAATVLGAVRAAVPTAEAARPARGSRASPPRSAVARMVAQVARVRPERRAATAAVAPESTEAAQAGAPTSVTEDPAAEVAGLPVAAVEPARPRRRAVRVAERRPKPRVRAARLAPSLVAAARLSSVRPMLARPPRTRRAAPAAADRSARRQQPTSTSRRPSFPGRAAEAALAGVSTAPGPALVAAEVVEAARSESRPTRAFGSRLPRPSSPTAGRVVAAAR